MRKTFRYRLLPTKSQRTKLDPTLELCRWVYNETLATRKRAWEREQKSLSLYGTNKLLTLWKAARPELNEVYSQVLQNVQERVDLAFQAFFRRVKAGHQNGYPRFKGYGRYDSFTFKPYGFGFKAPQNGRLNLSKIGSIKIRLHRLIEGEIKTLTLQRDRVGNWYACFSCVVEPKPLPVSPQVIGIDVGLSKFAALSTGESISIPSFLKRDEADLKRIQRKLSKLDQGTPQRHKAIKALNHVHIRIKHRRSDFAHKQSQQLINKYQIICFEDLDIQDMQHHGNKRINKSIADVAWAQFVNMTTGKAEEAGRLVI